MPQFTALNARYPSDLARVTVLRCFGIRADTAGNTWKTKSSIPFLAVILSPLTIALVRQALGHSAPHGKGAYAFWLCYYVALDLAMVLAAWTACRALHRAMPSLDRMLTRRGKEAVHGWIDRGVQPWRQERWMLTGAAGSCLALWVLSTLQEAPWRLPVGAMSYATVALSGAVGTNGLYWLIRSARLSRLVTKRGNVKLAWPSPARTPGVEALSRWYRIVTLWIVVISTATSAPLVWLSPHMARHGAYLVTKWVLAGTMLVAILSFGLYSQWRLSKAVLDKRGAVLQMLARRLPRQPPGDRPLTADEAQAVELFTQVSESPSGVINGQTLASTLLSVAAILVPLAVTALLR
ncbi:hypothetical protein RKE29_11840 [Streptomyces sp. B1866]|uniref:hypothetical protein n=1 Tax=Streptomyces sp. B1866 TaxID=3075431 RepID=UPI002890F37F|nr:hypothetical protein [Streptomyces sp. B1866]MDT3397331.1 hypothetical protein [Streptomyces sp. B1866]